MSPGWRVTPPLPFGAVVLAVALAVVLLTSGAWADAVPPPPEGCPAGSLGNTGHLGPWCEPTTCVTDSDCPEPGTWRAPRSGEPLVCREQSLCVERRALPGGSPPFRADTRGGGERLIAAGVCGGPQGCAAPARCETAKRCVVAGAAGTSRGCGCSMAADRPSAAWIAASTLLVVWSARRRNRRRR